MHHQILSYNIDGMFCKMWIYRNIDIEYKLLECRQNTRSLFDAKNSLSNAKVSHELGTLLDSA